jgi:predicted Zn finger-like uncharacterized protein
MPTTIDCPSCNRKLRVPDDLLGKEVKCPTCGTTFTAAESTAPPPVEAEEPSAPARARPSAPPDEYEEEPPARGSEGDGRRRRRSRAHLQPHRGTLILVLGILGLVAFQPLGIVAWVLGNNDLKEMRAGRMDPEGEGQTNAGRICGMIATIMMGLSLLCACGFIAIAVIAAIAGSNH